MLKPEKLRSIGCQIPLPEKQRSLTWKLLSLLKQCVTVNQLREIQGYMLSHSVEKTNFLIPKAISLGDSTQASLLFSAMEKPNEYSFNVMIRGSATKWHNYGEALSLYRRMKFSGLKPDNFTYPFVFIVCGNLSELEVGRSVHSSVLKVGLESDDHIRHTLITMYARCRQLGCARKVFDEITDKDIVSWNSMISGYSQTGHANKAVDLFRRMKEEGIEADEKTLVSVLGACADLGDLRTGKLVEEIAMEKRMEMSTFFGSSLISMYGSCGELSSASRVFNETMKKDRVTWNAMITAYGQNGKSEEAICLFRRMKEIGILPDAITSALVLSACASMGSLELGKQIESYAWECGFQHNIYVATGLIDMYAKCGSLDDARRVFEAMPTKNQASWNAMISALAFHGRPHEAISLFECMTVPPDNVTFIQLLSACVHAGLVDQGRRFFCQMSSLFGLVPKIEHYSSMVDLLSRAGLLEEAWEFMQRMPEKPDGTMLGAMLGACQKRNNVELGEKVMKLLLEMEPSNSGNYVISSRVYAEMNMWDECAKMRALMRDRGVVKTPGCSWIEITSGKIREFHAGDDLSHGSRESQDVLWMLGALVEEMKWEGDG